MRRVKLKKLKQINGLHLAANGEMLVLGGAEVRGVDEAIWVDVAEGKETDRIELMADCYAVTPDLSKMAVGSSRDLDESIPGTHIGWFTLMERGLWKTYTVAKQPGYVEVFGLAFDPTGKRLAVSLLRDDDAEGNGRDEFFVLPVGDRGKRIDVPGDAATCGVIAFSPDGKRIATSGGLEGGPEVVVLDGKTLKPVAEFDPSGTNTRQLVYSPSGDELAVVNGRNVVLVSANTGVPRLTLPHPKQVNSVAFSPDRRKLLSGCHDNQVRVWDVQSGELLQSYDWKIGAVTALTFAPDGLTVAAGGEKGQVVVWDWE